MLSEMQDILKFPSSVISSTWHYQSSKWHVGCEFVKIKLEYTFQVFVE